MRMRFATGDETAYQQRRHELRGQFATWLLGHPMPVDPFDADVLMDWKFGYGDGALDRWMIKDVEEFLFEWCPRELSAPPEDAELVPLSVAAFVEFLDDAGLLAPMSSRPAEVRRHCEASTAEFLEVMADPTKFGLAKSLFSGGPRPTPRSSTAWSCCGRAPRRSCARCWGGSTSTRNHPWARSPFPTRLSSWPRSTRP